MKRFVNELLGKLNWGKRAYAVLALCAITAVALPAKTFTTLFTFDGTNGANGTDGANPNGLVQATNGELYGTTYKGGANCAPYGCGTVFKITPSGTLTTLYSFCTQGGCMDGSYPEAGLIQAGNGDFYGTTHGGGTNCTDTFGCGTIFKITPGGALTTVYSFCAQSSCTDGEFPAAGLFQGSNGDLYGTTTYGGIPVLNSSFDYGYGTIFKITPSGTLTTLYAFCEKSGCTDGQYPNAGLVQATNGDFYGTTFWGGANCGGALGCGTVFKITPSGTLTTLYSFCTEGGSCTDGYEPTGLVQATDGDLWGATNQGGANGSGGTIFKITPSGTLTTVYSPPGGAALAALVQGTDGNLYGVTGGTVFKITLSGVYTTLYKFCSQTNCADGTGASAPLLQNTDGTFYGTTSYGGIINPNGCWPSGCGTVFSLSVGLGPFVKTQTTSGKVGAAVKILGSDLTGATSVTFNGTAAAFTVVSPSLITTTVPAGATSGKVEVVTPGGTLSSNVPFRVP